LFKILTKRKYNFLHFFASITGGPGFTFSDFDMVGGFGFAFDVFSVTPLFLGHKVFWFLIASIAKCCFIVFNEDGLKIIRNV